MARQLRLRDLAGLIVIDFIDMMENRSNRAVERKLKDCLKDDRARIQVGRISHFGLMEMSRQRIRFGVVESSTHKCPMCDGTGLVRSVESLALMIMRNIEDHVLRRHGQSINVRVPVEVALYILNFKRETLTALEIRNQLSITITADAKMTGHQFAIEKGDARVTTYVEQRAVEHVRVDSATIDDGADDEIEDEAEVEDEEVEEKAVASAETGDGEGRTRRRRRRRRGGAERGDEGGQRPPQQRAAQAPADDVDADAGEGEGDADEGDENGVRTEAEGADGEPRRRRRRGRRGGRRNRRDGEEGSEPSADADAGAEASTEDGTLTTQSVDAVADALLVQEELAETPVAAPAEAEAPEKPKRTRRRKPAAGAAAAPAETADAPVDAVAEQTAEVSPAEQAAAAEEKPKRKPRARKPKASDVEAETAAAAPSVAEPAPVAVEPAAIEPAVAAPEPVAAAEAEAEAPKSRRVKKELPAEGVVVSSSAPKTEDAPTDEPTAKKKAGWWQRRLGLG